MEVISVVLKDTMAALTVLTKRGRLLPYFIVVLDGRIKNTKPVVQAYQRVVSARLNDAQFFLARDQQKDLADRLAELDKLMVHKTLGSYADKTKRLKNIIVELCAPFKLDKKQAVRSAQLSKCDLLTEMVMEFPDLQGLIGGHYAHKNGEPLEVTTAIAAHYRPAYAGDDLPDSALAGALALADKSDTLIGLLATGHQPSGSRDPYGLRRLAAGIVRILFKSEIDLSISQWLETVSQAYSMPLQTNHQQTQTYLLETLENYLRSSRINKQTHSKPRYTPEVVSALMAIKPDNWQHLKKRLTALQYFVDRSRIERLVMANKRMHNILKKQGQLSTTKINEQDLSEAKEQALYQAYKTHQPSFQQAIQTQNYAQALKTLNQLGRPIDAFFAEVMVMDKDANKRANRLALLHNIQQMFLHIADFSYLNAHGKSSHRKNV